MNLYESTVAFHGSVKFPSFEAEKVYMLPFHKADGLPANMQKRWQPTVDAMLANIETDGPIYLMIDQAVVPAGTYHRRPGLHIDGYWCPDIKAHGPYWSPSRPAHGPARPTHIGSKMDWNGDYSAKETVVLASDVSASRALDGYFWGDIGEGGDCSKVHHQHMVPIEMEANEIYSGPVTLLHETLKVKEDCLRTLVRLNVTH